MRTRVARSATTSSLGTPPILSHFAIAHLSFVLLVSRLHSFVTSVHTQLAQHSLVRVYLLPNASTSAQSALLVFYAHLRSTVSALVLSCLVNEPVSSTS